MVNRSVKESDLIINDRKAHCPQQTSYNKATQVTEVTKEAKLPNSKINQPNRIINRTSSTIKLTEHKILKVFHQNIPGLKNKRNELISSLYSAIPHTYYASPNTI
jgi:predicted RNA-binding protein